MKLNVLIVDDSPVIRLVIKRTLNLCGLRIGDIIEASDGREALNKLKERTFGLIIADLNMPVMRGSEMLSRIKEDPEISQIPVLTISAESNLAYIEHVTDLSSDFLHKPFATEVLRDKILKLLPQHTITKTSSELVLNEIA